VKTASPLKLVFYVAIPLAILAFFISPLRGRVCISEFRLTNDQQQIDAALNRYVESLRARRTFEDANLKVHEIATTHSTVEEFKSRFPQCCKVVEISDSEKIGTSQLTWITGDIGSFVAIEFKVPYRDAGGKLQEIAHWQEVPVSTCEKVATEVYFRPIGRSSIDQVVR
jgi:hypothetical protein